MLAVRAVGTIVSGASRVGRNATCLHRRLTRHPRPPFDSAHSLRMLSPNLRSPHFPLFEGKVCVGREHCSGVPVQVSADVNAWQKAQPLLGENHAGSRSGARRKNWCL